MTFGGYAAQPGEVLAIQGLDKQTDEWVVIDTVTTQQVPVTLDGGATELYPWRKDGVDTTATGACIWGDPEIEGCPIEAGGAQAQFRVEAVDEGGEYRLVTFDEDDALECVGNEIGGGATWLEAGWNCRSSPVGVLTLHSGS